MRFILPLILLAGALEAQIPTPRAAIPDTTTPVPDTTSQAPTLSPGRIVGRVVDAQTGAGIVHVGLGVAGTAIGTMTGVDGQFEIDNVPAGVVTLIVKRIGYMGKTLTGITVQSGAAIEQIVSLDPSTTRLKTQVISAVAERGSVSEALDRQRTATSIVNSVTREQITRSPDSDAAQAMKRVSGVTIQDGKYVFVRGLGERYTTTLLNGSRIPSPEPEKKVVPLDLFPAGLLQSITTSKTFTPDQSGDFSGAQVNIQTREFPARRSITYSTSFGYNSAISGSTLLNAPRSGSEWLGFSGRARDIPALVKANGDFTGADQTTINQAIRSFRNKWNPISGSASPNYSFAASMGGRARLLGEDVGYIASGTYGNSQDVRQNESIASAVANSAGGTDSYNAFSGSSISTSVIWGGILNLSTLLGQKTRLALNNSYNRTADNEAIHQTGIRDDFSFPARRSALSFVERSVRSNQLRLEHVYSSSKQIDFSFASSGVMRNEPDRTELTYVQETNPFDNTLFPLALFSDHIDGARKTFSLLKENGISAELNYKVNSFKIGGSYRYAARDAEYVEYSILSFNLPRSVREQSAEEIFDGAYTDGNSSYFRIQRNPLGGDYTSEEGVGAGYLMLEKNLGGRVRLITGARVENAQLRVKSLSTLNERVRSRLNDTDVLPSVTLNIKLTESQNLRTSASQTLSRPEYRELSPNSYRDLQTRRIVRGNPDLERSLIQNFDLRWEWYPRGAEIVSLGFFGKVFTAPIERIEVATSGANDLSYINADGGSNYGVEFDLRKRMGFIADKLEQMTFFTNATVMKSAISLNEARGALTNETRPMTGQAPYVVNAGLTFSNTSGRASGTMLYNVVGKRLDAAGTAPLPDSYEQPRGVLDFSLQLPLWSGLAAKLDAKNLLDSPYEITQGSIVRERYHAGRAYSFGLRWQP